MAQEGLLVEIDRAVERLYGIAAGQEPTVRDEVADIAKGLEVVAEVAMRLEEARAAYPFTRTAIDGVDVTRDFHLSPEADEACVALRQFATIDSVATSVAFVAFSADLAGADLLTSEERAHRAAREGITVARVPASESLDEARANLIAGLAWQLEWSKALLASATATDEISNGRRVESVQHHLFGGTDVVASRTPHR